MLDVLMDQYSKNGDPTKVLEAFLAIHATGKFSLFDASAYKTDAAMYTHDSVMKELVHTYGVDACVLWNAMILKKRILVHGDSVEQITKYVRTLPQLVFQRLDWGMCRPIVSSEPEHMEDLASCGFFVAGTMDNQMVSKTDTNQLTKKHLLVLVQRVDDNIHQSVHFRLEFELLARASERLLLFSSHGGTGTRNTSARSRSSSRSRTSSSRTRRLECLFEY